MPSDWPWRRKQDPPPPPPPEPVQLSEEADLRLKRLEHEFAVMQQEWSDTLDRIGRHFARIAARERSRLQRDIAAAEGNAQDALGDTNAQGEAIGSGQNPQDRKAALRAQVNSQRLRRA